MTSRHRFTTPDTAPVVGRGVEYVRMSTEHQQYSTDNQQDTMRKFATQHNITVIRTYLDAGKSGLRLSGRAALSSC